ncbi:MAG: putative lipid II flippase FtsW [Puniceicoccales bacterium]|jgi:cell division protein FtsW|nr:putative lipid II flippase FtsW [Puniceicoccales bacterium]
MLIDKLEGYYSYFSQRKAGWFVLFVVLSLTGVGMVVLSSASLSFIGIEDYLLKQLQWLAVGIPLFIAGCLIELKFLQRYCRLLLFAVAVGLVSVLIPGIGKMVNGSRRWLSFGGFNVQISEFAKIAVIIWLSSYLEANKFRIKDFSHGFLIPLAVPGIISALVLMEPDYGTAILIGVLSFALLFLAGTRLLYLMAATVGGLFVISAMICLNPTRLRRIVAFLDVDGNKLGGAYQLWQGMLGFVSGGLFGRGIGQGRQQLVYLPEAHTDFIFPILSEELGSLVAIAALMLYATFFLVTTSCARKIGDDFQKFTAYGVSLTIILQTLINVGVVTGLLPTKGMVLPFMSYGGSNLVSLFFMVGMVLNCFSSDLSRADAIAERTPKFSTGTM